ncbi:hypothetical protein K469DRAFT_707474 [Zopfia rhizophila CBS 207.26]|uniref:Uncharacterized protein n=1 Tax=Zopfia rhizophila CBS 207.26 TaxID=1314779 RepID=A0A6A6E7H6_9PEZI|nr:hypothetical protein K469DRAFT_707474 [Zopfia rhizophila CBS 207.26]
MHRQALEGYKKVLGPEHSDTLTSINNLGSALERQNKYEEAEAMHQRALEGREKMLGPEHPHTLASISNLGTVLERQGKYEKAEELVVQVIAWGRASGHTYQYEQSRIYVQGWKSASGCGKKSLALSIHIQHYRLKL